MGDRVADVLNAAADREGLERPSRHGAILGRALAALAEAGGGCAGACSTCAFREGTMPNQMAATGLTALHCVIGTDPDDFACHHGMTDGQPTHLCAGYIAAKSARFENFKGILGSMKADLDAMSGPDHLRASFDAWRANQPDDMDEYQLARAWSRQAARQSRPQAGGAGE